jgi:Zn-dependent protease
MDVRPEGNEPEQAESANYPWNGEWGTIPPPPPEHAAPPSTTPTPPAGPPARHLAPYVPYIAEHRAAQQASQANQASEAASASHASADMAPRSAPIGRKDAAGCASGAAIVAVLSKVALAGKVLLPFLSAIASLVAYALLFGWQFGLGILVLLFVHEMGHYIVIRAKGIPASWPVFIPLLGAYVAMRRMPANVRDEAEIAIAGPFAGAMASALCFWLYQVTGVDILLPLAYFSFLINLLNLVPVSPLDGGRVVGAISRWIWPIGLVAMGVAFLYTHSILLLVLLWLGLMETISRFRSMSSGDPYYRVPLLSRAYVTIFYFGLAAALAIGMFATEGLMIARAGQPIFGG